MARVLVPEKNVQSDVIKQLEKFGKFQILQYFLVCLPLFLMSMANVNYVFVAEDINYRCRVPMCESDNPSIEQPSWWPASTDGRCFKPVVDVDKYSANNHTCSNDTFLEVQEECHDWIYENNNSIVATLDLGCQSWKATLVGTVHNTGVMMSMMFAGWLSDKIGRKPTIILCTVSGGIGVTKIFVTNYYGFLGVEFLESLLAAGLYTVGVVLLMEVGGESKSVLAGVISSYALNIGEVGFALIAMGLQNWKSVVLVVYAPLILFIVYAFVLRESSRWEVLSGRMTKAKQTFKLIAKMNKLEITPNEIDDIDDAILRFKLNIEIQDQKENIKDILGSRQILVRVAVTSWCFFTSSFLYYGMVVHSVLLPGNKYTNFLLMAMASFPGDLLAYFMFNKFGNRITLQCGYFITAVLLVAQTYSPDSIVWLKVLLFLIGKLGVMVCFTGIYTYSLDLYPTSVRGSLLGFGSTVSRLGGMLAPLTVLLVPHMSALPSIIFAATAVTSTFLLTLTPETKHLPSFDTIAQINAYDAKVKDHESTHL